MTEEHLVAKKLLFIEQCVKELRERARPELIAADTWERGSASRSRPCPGAVSDTTAE